MALTSNTDHQVRDMVARVVALCCNTDHPTRHMDINQWSTAQPIKVCHGQQINQDIIGICTRLQIIKCLVTKHVILQYSACY